MTRLQTAAADEASARQPKNGAVKRCFMGAAILLSSLAVFSPASASYGKADSMKLFNKDSTDKKKITEEKKGDVQFVTTGEYLLVTSASYNIGDSAGKCYGIKIAKVTEDRVEFYIETSVLGEKQCDEKVKTIKFGEQKNFKEFGFDFTIKAECGDAAGTAKLTFICQNC